MCCDVQIMFLICNHSQLYCPMITNLNSPSVPNPYSPVTRCQCTSRTFCVERRNPIALEYMFLNGYMEITFLSLSSSMNVKSHIAFCQWCSYLLLLFFFPPRKKSNNKTIYAFQNICCRKFTGTTSQICQ